jgi:uncharacterized protein
MTESPSHPAHQVTPPAGSDDRLATALRGFGPVGLLAILVILAGNVLLAPLGAILVLFWAKASRTPWRDIGYVRPRSWALTVLGGLMFGIAFKLLMKSVVMPLLGADPHNHAYQFLIGNRAAAIQMSVAVIFIAGFGEETLFRGYMFERLGKLLGSGRGAKTFIVLLTSIVFASLHIREQGISGAEQALITGLTFGTIFAVTGRIWMLMIAHAAFDLTAIWIIFRNLETKFAHLFFQ